MKKALLQGLMGLFLALGSLYTVQAAHIIGGEITYKSAGNDSFDIIMILYRDCNSIPLSSGVVAVSSTCTTFNVTVLPVSYRDITGIPSYCSVQSRCSGSFPYGFEEWVFKKRIYLGGISCCEFTLSWTDCCRNTGITGPSYDYYISSSFDKCLAPTNSSPVYTSVPKILLPLNKVQFISFNAFDADGDSLSYELVPPLISSSTALPYSGMFSYQRPCTFQGFPNATAAFPSGFRIDNVTGNVIFKPTKLNEFFYYVVTVTEWRKIGGVYKPIGTIRRDVQTIVTNSPTNSPPFFLTEKPALTICDGIGTYCLDIPVTDSDNDTLTLTYEHQLTNITFNNVGSPTQPIIRVCYTPTTAEFSSGLPLLVKIKAADGACTLEGVSEKTFYFKRRPLLPDSFALQKSLTCNSLFTQFDNPAATLIDAKVNWQISSYKDTVKADVKVVAPLLKDTGWHYIKMSVYHDEYCDTVTHFDSVYIPLSNFISVALGKDTSICFDPSFAISSTITNGNTPLKYNWYTGDTLPAITPTLALGTNLYALEVTDANGCVAYDSITVKYFNPTVVLSGDTVKCANKPLMLTATIANAIKPVFGWSGFPSGMAAISTTLTASSVFTFNLTDSAGCSVTKQHNVTVYNPQLSVQKTAVCEVDSVPLSAMATGGLAPYNYSWSPFSLSGNSVVVAPMGAGSVPFSITVTDSFGCIVTRKDTVLIHPTPLITLTQPIPLCQTNTAVSLAAFVTPSGGTWSGTGVSGNSFSPSASGAGTFPLTYSYTNPLTGCSNQGQTSIDVQAQPNADFTVDVTSADTGHVFSFTDATQNPVSPFRDWTFGDPLSGSNNTSSSLNPSHQFSDTGWFTVRMITPGGVCAADTMIKSNYIYVYKTGSSIGINTVIKNNVKLYPNPSNGLFTLEADFDITAIKIVDALGKTMPLQTYQESTNKILIDITRVSSGIYHVYVFDKNAVSTVYRITVNE